MQEVVHLLGLLWLFFGLDGAVGEVKLFSGAVRHAHARNGGRRVEVTGLDLAEDQLAVLDLVQLGLLGLFCA